MDVLNCFLLMIAGTVLCSCSQPADGYRVERRGNKVIVQMDEYEPAFRNTMKGWREFFAPGTDVRRACYPYPYGTMNKEYMQWNMMERVASDGVDKVTAYSNHRWEGVEDINMKVIPRAFLVWVEPWHGGKPKDPSNQDDLNGWHWPDDMPGQTSPYRNVPGEWTCYLNPEDSLTQITGGYFHPDFASRVEKFVEKLGKAWDNDPRVAYVEMGIVGEWGEHHDPDLSTYWPPHDEPEHIYGRTWVDGLEKVLGDAFSKAFRNKKVMVRYAYEFKDYEFGIYWDSWAIEQEQTRGYGEMLKLGDRWKTQPVGGEITWNWGNLKIAGFRSLEDCLKDPDTFLVALEQIRNLHCNHLGGVTWADWSDSLFLRKAGELQKAMGYRYVLDKAEYDAVVKSGEKVSCSFSLTNTGSSPFYYDWPLEIALLDRYTHKKVFGYVVDGVRITEWMPGDKWNVDTYDWDIHPEKVIVDADFVVDDIPCGEYILALAILDPSGMLPSVRFANTNYFEGGYTPLGYIGIDADVADAALPESEFDDIQNDRTLKYIFEK